MAKFSGVRANNCIRLKKHVISAFKAVRAEVFSTHRSLYPPDMTEEGVNRDRYVYLNVTSVEGDTLQCRDLHTMKERTFKRDRAYGQLTGKFKETTIDKKTGRETFDFWGWEKLTFLTPPQAVEIARNREKELYAAAAAAQAEAATYTSQVAELWVNCPSFEDTLT